MTNLALKYRPQIFRDIVGQKLIVEILERQISEGKWQGAYLFAGPSGSGKTSTARIFARALNGGQGEPIEIDGASNNGVDNARKIVEISHERSMDSPLKIFIIDECHSFTTQAWQVMLKCIEEYSPHTVFIFCTTEVDKVPEAIKSRLQSYYFTALVPTDIQDRLRWVCQQEGIFYEESGLSCIAQNCEGNLRKSLMCLEEASLTGKVISEELASHVLGVLPLREALQLMLLIKKQDEEGLLRTLSAWIAVGYPPAVIHQSLKHLLTQLIYYTIDPTLPEGRLLWCEKELAELCASPDKSTSYYMSCFRKLLQMEAQGLDKDTLVVGLLSITRCAH